MRYCIIGPSDWYFSMSYGAQNDRVKLLIVVKSIDGGTGTYVLSLLKLKDDEKIDVLVLSLERPSYRKVDDKLPVKYVNSDNFYPQRYLFSPKNIFNFGRELFKLGFEIKNWEPDVIVGVDIHANLLTSILKPFFLKDLKTILTTHIHLGNTISQKGNRLLKFVLKLMVGFFYNQASVLVCVSKGVAQNLKDEFGIRRKIDVIYNGFSVPKQSAKKLVSKTKKINFLTVARLVEQKDHKTLLEAFGRVVSRFPNAVLWIVGEGPLKSEMVKQAKKLKILHNVKFFGWVSEQVKISLFLRANVFVLSSNREGFGYVLVEAMLLGLPVISTNTPYGPEEILDGGKYGILIPVGNVAKMEEALLRFLNNDNLAKIYSAKSRKRAEFFTEEKMLNNYKQLVMNL